MPVLAGDTATAAQWNLDTLGGTLIARGRRETNSTTTTSEVGVLRLDDIPILAGRTYIIDTSSLSMDGNTANDILRATIRYTTDGTTPTTSSTILVLAQELQANASFSVFCNPRASYTPAGNETLSLLLTVARATGAGTVGMVGSATNPIELFVIDMGEDVGDTGTDI